MFEKYHILIIYNWDDEFWEEVIISIIINKQMNLNIEIKFKMQFNKIMK